MSRNGLDVGAYLGPLALAMIVGGILLYQAIGFSAVIIYAVIFYVLLRFWNSVDREVKKQDRIESRRSRRYWRRRYWKR